MTEKSKKEKGEMSEASEANVAPASSRSLAISGEGKTALCVRFVDAAGSTVTLSDLEAFHISDFVTGRLLDYEISQKDGVMFCQFAGNYGKRMVGFALNYPTTSSCDETHYAFTWTNNVVVLPAAGNPSCRIDLPVSLARQPIEMAKLQVKVHHCEHESGAHEHHEHHEHRDHLGPSSVLVQPLDPNTGIRAQTKQTNNGCAEFFLSSGQWYAVSVKGRVVHPCGPIHLFACAGEPAELSFCCKPLNRSLRLLFQDDCGQPVPNVAFRMYGREFLGDSTGTHEICDPQPGRHRLESMGPLAFSANEIEVGHSYIQTELIQVNSDQSTTYAVDFHVEAELEMLEKIHIQVIDPRTGQNLPVLVPNPQGRAKCFVAHPGAYQAVLIHDGKVIDTQDAIPTATSN